MSKHDALNYPKNAPNDDAGNSGWRSSPKTQRGCRGGVSARAACLIPTERHRPRGFRLGVRAKFKSSRLINRSAIEGAARRPSQGLLSDPTPPKSEVGPRMARGLRRAAPEIQ